MMEEINFPNWEVLVHGSEVNHHTITNMSTIFIRDKNGDYFYLYDETDKVYDVSRMPSYISEDWVNYNKKEINNAVLEKWIAQFSSVGLVETDYLASELKSIKRDLIMKKIL